MIVPVCLILLGQVSKAGVGFVELMPGFGQFPHLRKQKHEIHAHKELDILGLIANDAESIFFLAGGERQIEGFLHELLGSGVIAQMDEIDRVIVESNKVVHRIIALMSGEDSDAFFKKKLRIGIASLILGEHGQLDQHHAAAMVVFRKPPSPRERLLVRGFGRCSIGACVSARRLGSHAHPSEDAELDDNNPSDVTDEANDDETQKSAKRPIRRFGDNAYRACQSTCNQATNASENHPQRALRRFTIALAPSAILIGYHCYDSANIPGVRCAF
jgi:hypothetical protein